VVPIAVFGYQRPVPGQATVSGARLQIAGNGFRASRSRTCSRCWRFGISRQSRHSERTVRLNRSATPFACGARNGVRMIVVRQKKSPRPLDRGPKSPDDQKSYRRDTCMRRGPPSIALYWPNVAGSSGVRATKPVSKYGVLVRLKISKRTARW
jgi:hypothetical protein